MGGGHGEHRRLAMGRERRAAQLVGEEGKGEQEARVTPCEADGTTAGVEQSKQKAQAGRQMQDLPSAGNWQGRQNSELQEILYCPKDP